MNTENICHQCPVCQSDSNLFYNLFDDRYGFPGKFKYYRCNSCGLVFQEWQMSDDDIKELYSEYYPRATFDEGAWKPANWKPGFLSWLDGYSRAFMLVPSKVRVLDIGCGFGESIGYHKNRGCDAYGVEVDENAQRVADKFNLNINQGIFKSENYQSNSFDFVTMDQVLEHIYDPIPFLKDVLKVLNSKGELIITVPNVNGLCRYIFGKYWIHWHPPYHVRLYSKKSVSILLKQAGFVVSKIYTRTSSPWLSYQFYHLFSLPDEGEKSKFWDPRATKNLKQPFILKLLVKSMVILEKFKIPHLITRLLDLIRIGDGLVIVAKPSVIVEDIPVTLFTSPKGFDGHNNIIQRNALKNWKAIGLSAILFGNDKGVAEAAEEFGFIHVPDVKCSDYNTPLLSDMFLTAQRLAKTSLVSYINTDILLPDNFINEAKHVKAKFENFLLIGQRYDVDINTELDFSEGWSDNLQKVLIEEGVLHSPTGIDYFVFPTGMIHYMPEFSVGRPGWDNWLVWHMRKKKIPIVDASVVLKTIHQNHDYKHIPGGDGKTWENSPEAIDNRRILAWSKGFVPIFNTILHANYRITQKGFKRGSIMKRINWDVKQSRSVNNFLRIKIKSLFHI